MKTDIRHLPTLTHAHKVAPEQRFEFGCWNVSFAEINQIYRGEERRTVVDSSILLLQPRAKKTSSSVRSVDFSKGPDADLDKRRCGLLPPAKFSEGVLGLAPRHVDCKINEETAQACQRDVSFDITLTWCRLRWHTNQSRTCAP